MIVMTGIAQLILTTFLVSQYTPSPTRTFQWNIIDHFENLKKIYFLSVFFSFSIEWLEFTLHKLSLESAHG